ncbi:hypothetical protein CDM12_22210 [Salmonella enterica]|nr:hypothetical protein [Salmonella enterica]EDX7330591.1 hypothetical protein [Salmonella enterica subsp. enterica serovar Florida]EBE4178361.1 hypothetical protein [Salmonella enterica]EBK3095132.1 hypothetical protein [Salmonella enterica]EBS7449876.1 hypothetical protein [Salmonella enterica]
MSMFRYLKLRVSQQVLCLSFSVPVAIFLTTAFSSFGTWSVSLFFVYLMTLMVLTWGGLALYTRETDRVRQLADSRMIAVRNSKCVIVARMKHHEKARLVWEVLQDDGVIRRQLQAWWRGISRYLTLSFRYLPATVLMTAFLVSWLEPDTGVKIVEQFRECSAESVVRWAAGGLACMYMVTGLAWFMCDILMNRLPVNCFREAFLAKVAAYQQQDDDTSFSGTDAAAEHAELREGGK